MNRTTILIENTTKKRLKQLGTKGQTYDEVINQLINNEKKYPLDHGIVTPATRRIPSA
jgi:hypothetical protein